MTNKQFYICVGEATGYPDRDAYISDIALSTLWEDGESNEIPPDCNRFRAGFAHSGALL